MKVKEAIEILQSYPQDENFFLLDPDTGWLLKPRFNVFHSWMYPAQDGSIVVTGDYHEDEI